MVNKGEPTDPHRQQLAPSINCISNHISGNVSPQLITKHIRNLAPSSARVSSSPANPASVSNALPSHSSTTLPTVLTNSPTTSDAAVSSYNATTIAASGQWSTPSLNNYQEPFRPPTCPPFTKEILAQAGSPSPLHSFSCPLELSTTSQNVSPTLSGGNAYSAPLSQQPFYLVSTVNESKSNSESFTKKSVANGCLPLNCNQQLYAKYHLGHQSHRQTVREMQNQQPPLDQLRLQPLLEQPNDDNHSISTGIYNPQLIGERFLTGRRPIDFVLVYNRNWRPGEPVLQTDGRVILPPPVLAPTNVVDAAVAAFTTGSNNSLVPDFLTKSDNMETLKVVSGSSDDLQEVKATTTAPTTSKDKFLQVIHSTRPGSRSQRNSFLFSVSSGGKNEQALSSRARYLAECCYTFEENLISEGLRLEYSSAQFVNTESQQLGFVKIYAPWKILSRYAEFMKLKMPMKQIETSWRMMFGENDPYKKGRFTAPYSRDKEYLFDIPDDRRMFFTQAQRAQIVEFILKRKSFSTNLNDASSFGINKLLQDNAYLAAYPLHEGMLEIPKSAKNSVCSTEQRRCLEENDNSARIRLLKGWGSLKKMFSQQPLDDIRAYFGVKIALYFAWLGFYTMMLIPASVVGLLCFLYGVITMENDVPVKQVCNHTFDHIPMCPLCNIKACDFWNMSETCSYTRISYLFDNPATVFFAVFMSLWATVFLEMWKRYSSRITHRWDLSTFDNLEDYPRPEFLARLTKSEKKKLNVITRMDEPYVPFWKKQLPYTILSGSVVLLLIVVALASVLGVIVYRVSVRAALANNDDLVNYSSLLTSSTAALINLTCILIFKQIYGYVVLYLTELEMPRTQTDFDNSLTLKMYLLQFVNYYSSLFYIAFFKGRFVSHPGEIEDNSRFASFTQEECGTGGCLVELAIQLSIIMVGKQAFNSVLEMLWPWFEWLWRFWRIKRPQNTSSGKNFSFMPQWEADYMLAGWKPEALFYEYLEMVLQFGFVTIFVAAFPLAPLFALINNALEIRLDAQKMIISLRRPVAQRVKNIGIWYRILDAIGKLSVVTNGVVIAFTSDFIPRLFHYSQYGSLDMFMNHTLSYFNASEIETGNKEEFYSNSSLPHYCLYQGHRFGPESKERYLPTADHWQLLALKFGFVIIFQNVIASMVIVIRWIIPDVPRALRQQIRQHEYLTNELIIQQELKRAKEAQ